MRKTFLITLFMSSIQLNAQIPNKNQIYQYLYTAQYDSAISIINTILKTDSTSSEMHYTMGLAYSLQNNDRDALPYFERCYSLAPYNITNLSYLSKTYNNLGQTTQAIKILRQAIQIDSCRINIWNDLGKILYRVGNYQEADSAFYILSDLNHKNAFYPLMRARCAAKLDSLEKANFFYRQAYQLDTSHVKILFEYARNLFTLDSLDLATSHVNQAIKIEDRDWHLHRLKGDIFYVQRQYPASILCYLDAMTRGDKTLAVYKKLGFAYYLDGNYKKCINTLEQVLETENDDPVVYFYLGICFQQIEEYELAIQYLNDAIDCLRPDFLSDIHSTLADCHHKQSNYLEAIQHFREALELADEKEKIYYQLANVYDDYYADKSVALKYYQLAQKKEISPDISTFIAEKISSLQKEQFFNN